ncbi:unnamed protein product [Caretta caretta]
MQSLKIHAVCVPIKLKKESETSVNVDDVGMVRLRYGLPVSIPARTTHLVNEIAQVDQKATNQLILVEVPDTDALPGGLMVKKGVVSTSSCTEVSVN